LFKEAGFYQCKGATCQVFNLIGAKFGVNRVKALKAPLQIGADWLKIKHAKYIQVFTECFKI
jgi:hypothetical protein